MKKILLFAFLFYYSLINAQISFEKGYFIDNNNTKIECYIKNMEWNYNPTDFNYKINIEDNYVKTETITNVQEFGIDKSSKYKRAKVNIDISSVDLERLSNNKNPIWKEDVVFLKILVKNKASLYQYTSPEFTKFFYSTEDKEPEQLVYKEYIDEEINSRNPLENNYFRQQLLNNVKSENITENEIKRLPYKKESLMKYFLKYNNVSSEEIKKTITSENKSLYFLKITPGVGISSISINGTDGYKDVQYDTKNTFKIGLEGEFVLPFNKNKWSLFVNPTYQKYEGDSDTGIIVGINNGSEVRYPSKIKYSAIYVPIGVRHYFFLNNTSKIFLNASYGFDISGKFEYRSELRSLESSTGGSFAFGLGYNFKNKLSVEVRMNSKKEILNDYNLLMGNYKTLDFIFGYTIF